MWWMVASRPPASTKLTGVMRGWSVSAQTRAMTVMCTAFGVMRSRLDSSISTICSRVGSLTPISASARASSSGVGFSRSSQTTLSGNGPVPPSASLAQRSVPPSLAKTCSMGSPWRSVSRRCVFR